MKLPILPKYLPASASSLRIFGLLAALFLVGSLSAQDQYVAPPPGLEESQLIALELPSEQGNGPIDGGGFFPTLSETALLRGAYDARSYGGAYTVDSPDRREQLATDIFPYQDPVPNFYQRNEAVFKPLDRFFGFLTPFDTFTVENDRLRNVAVSVDANTGILTRNFSPEQAMIKVGPLFMDVLWLGTGVIWSDFTGPVQFPDGEEDGFTGYIELGVRLAARLTDTIYLTAGANIIYLPFNNDFAFQALTGGAPGAGLTAVYSDDLGPWSVSVYDYFQGRSGLNFLGQVTEDGYDRAGRYWFGIQQPGRANQFHNQEGVFFSNMVGASATRLVFDDQWRYWINADHTDFWRTFDFVDHGIRDHLGMVLGYEGSSIPFAPRFFYDVWDLDGLFQNTDALLHRVGMGLTGRLTENIAWDGDIGYLFGTGSDQRNQDSLLWNMGFTHTVTSDLTHYLRFGQSVFFNDFTNDALLSRYITYGFNLRLDRRSALTGFVQYADSEVNLIDQSEQRRYGAGLTLSWLPLDFTTFRLMGLLETIEQGAIETDRLLIRGEVSQQLGVRLTGQVFYQFEDSDSGPLSFYEHMAGLSVRRYF